MITRIKFDLMLSASLVCLLVFCLYVVSGCQTANVVMNSDVIYQRDLKMKVELEGRTFDCEGVCLVPRSGKYKITVFPKGKSDMVLITSHHREMKDDKPDQSWFSKGVSFEFIPNELDFESTLDVGVFEKIKGRHGWGLIGFKSDEDFLEATIQCNGQQRKWYGTSVCQTKAALVQEIAFDFKVKYRGTCELSEESSDGKIWRFQMPEGECVSYFGFKDFNGERRVHKMITYGYQSIPIRND